jgi:hypothetical protein
MSRKVRPRPPQLLSASTVVNAPPFAYSITDYSLEFTLFERLQNGQCRLSLEHDLRRVVFKPRESLGRILCPGEVCHNAGEHQGCLETASHGLTPVTVDWPETCQYPGLILTFTVAVQL